jgi:hypothetical protein
VPRLEVCGIDQPDSGGRCRDTRKKQKKAEITVTSTGTRGAASVMHMNADSLSFIEK